MSLKILQKYLWYNPYASAKADTQHNWHFIAYKTNRYVLRYAVVRNFKVSPLNRYVVFPDRRDHLGV